MTRGDYAGLTWLAVLSVAATAVITVPVKLVWNASASVPIGLYRIEQVDQLVIGDLVLVRPPEPLARFIAERHYVGPQTPLLKHVVALPGQRICRIGVRIILDGRHLGDALFRDSRGRQLPVWQGCQVIPAGQLFLMNPAVGDSLDGRYFGPLPASSVVGRALPIFLGSGQQGRLDWTGTAPQPLSQPPAKESLDATDRHIHAR